MPWVLSASGPGRARRERKLPGNALQYLRLSFLDGRMFVGHVMFFPRQSVEASCRRSFRRTAFGQEIWRSVLLLCATIFFLGVLTAPAGEEAGPANMLEASDKLFVKGPPGARIEPTASGGLKVVYSITEPPSKGLWLSVKRVFDPSVNGSAVSVDVPGFEGEILLNVWNEQKIRAFKALAANDNRVVDLYGLNYRGAKEDFNGNVHAVEIALLVPKFPGEHTIEIERFVLDR